MQSYEWGTMPEMFGPRHEHRIGFILRETARLEPGSRILEAAVGLGQLAARLNEQGHRVFGVDRSFDAVRHARENYGIPGVIGDMTAMPFRTGAFDALTSGETLEHLPEDAAAVREMARVVRDGGSCIATVPALESLRTFSDTYYEHLRRYSRTQLVALFEQAGFEVRAARFWGFPVVLAYDTLFILPMNHRRARTKIPDDPALRSIAGAGRSRWLVRLVRFAFSIDRVFSWVPIGVGLVVTARKRTGLVSG